MSSNDFGIQKKVKKMPPIFDVESLLLLVDEGDLDGVSALVAHKGEGVVQTKDEWGLTSLHLASATGNEVRKQFYYKLCPS